jgi:membrane-associated phospholipid phosphatase
MMKERSTNRRPTVDPPMGAMGAAHTSDPGVPVDSPKHLMNVSIQQLIRLAGLMVIWFLGLTAIWVGLGLLVTGPLANTWVGSADQDLANWLVAHRTPALNYWSHIGTMLGQTIVKIAVTALVAVAMLIRWRSWREPVLICLTVLLESTVFITVTGIVSRPRPGVAALDGVTVNSSFPSGHSAATAVYGAIAVVIFERAHTLWVRTITTVLAVTAPLIVGASRIYRGVHYLTDVIAGIALGIACVLVAYVIVRRVFDRPPLEGNPENDRQPKSAQR